MCPSGPAAAFLHNRQTAQGDPTMVTTIAKKRRHAVEQLRNDGYSQSALFNGALGCLGPIMSTSERTASGAVRLPGLRGTVPFHPSSQSC